jgi:hypothetical protein
VSAATSAWAWERREVGPLEKFVLVALADFTNGVGEVAIETEALSRLTGLSAAEVEDAMATLQGLRLITPCAITDSAGRLRAGYRIACESTRLSYEPGAPVIATGGRERI